MKKELKEEKNPEVNLNQKLESSIRILVEKLNQAGIETKDREIIIKNGKLTVN